MIKQSLLAFTLAASPAFADPATVENVNVTKNGSGYTFNVTVLHKDTGWDDYVDMWRIKDMTGKVLGERNLAHPHVDEQPFTRSLAGVTIPAGVDSVVIEAHDTVNGWSSNAKLVKLP
jgi:hypothetical protein